MSADRRVPATPELEALAERLEREPAVRVAWVFGSVARGTAGPLSDVDVAVLLDPSDDRSRGDAFAAVAEVVGSERADLVVLGGAPVALAFRVIRDGRVLVDRDPRARTAFWVRTVDRYLDMAPMRRTLADGLRHRVEEGRFGRP